MNSHHHPPATIGLRQGCGRGKDLGPAGRVAEWLKAPDSKSGLGETLTWVRIPPLPPIPFPRQFEEFRFKKKELFH
jgi:hypothetical protein